jgi:hypothetical protein
VEGIQSLKKRLQDKIAAMQGGRTVAKEDKKPRPDKRKAAALEEGDGEEEEDNEDNEEGDDDDDDEEEEDEEDAESDGDLSIDMDSGSEAEEYSDDGSDNGVDDTGDIDFSAIVSKHREPNEEVVRNAPGSKMKRLKQLVEDSKKKKQRLDDLRAQGGSGKERAAAEAWSDVIKEASGTKVLSNTKRLQKAIRAKEKKKEKSTAAWQGRVENLAADKTERINKREANIKDRTNGMRGIVAPAPVEGGDKGAAGYGLLSFFCFFVILLFCLLFCLFVIFE